MDNTLIALKQSVTDWAEDAQQQGLLSADIVSAINHYSTQTPASLFDAEERPLVVGFFGGTGVGKSTLLNRMAGEDIARTSVERPTSREVTMYLHSTVHVSHLPPEFPVDKIATAHHNNEHNRHILWVDMPDFDSAETANRQLVNDWLPHIDVLIYVVSPERYKDDHGWRLLHEHGYRHAWVFVINHWDRGTPEQRTDFNRMLIEAGLPQPLLYCTDSSGQRDPTTDDVTTTDEFNALQTVIQSMADDNTVRQLEARGITVRVTEMQTLVKNATAAMGSTDDFQWLETKWNEQWTSESASIHGSLQWKFPLLSEHYAKPESGLLSSLFSKATGKSNKTESPTPLSEINPLAGTQQIIDDETVSRIRDNLDELSQHGASRQLPVNLIRTHLDSLKPGLGKSLNDCVTQSLKHSLAKPGTPIQRFLHKLFTYMTAVLPIVAMGWVGYRIVLAFYAGGSTPAAYLSSNFAVNGLMLIALSWLLPFFLARKTKPSLVRAAHRGLNEGTQTAMENVRTDVLEQLTTAASAKESVASRGKALFETNHSQLPAPTPAHLQRVLITENQEAAR